MTQVTKSTMIGELLQIDENIAPILLNIGMHCLGCHLPRWRPSKRPLWFMELSRMLL